MAAEQVGEINPSLRGRVRGLTLKVGPETENVFDAAFWKDTDVVITALVRVLFGFENLASISHGVFFCV